MTVHTQDWTGEAITIDFNDDFLDIEDSLIDYDDEDFALLAAPILPAIGGLIGKALPQLEDEIAF